MMRESQIPQHEHLSSHRNVFNVSEPDLNDGFARNNMFLIRRSMFRRKFSFFLVLAIIIVLFVLFVAITILYVATSTTQPLPSLCTSESCLNSASILISSMNKSVDPCENFYEYVCGRWAQKFVNYPTPYVYFSNFQKLQESLLVPIIDFVKSNGTDDEPLPVRQSKDFYKSCMKETSNDQSMYSTITKYLDIAKLPLVPNALSQTKRTRVNHTFDWIRASTDVRKTLGTDLFVGFRIAPNVIKVDENVMFLGSERIRPSIDISQKLKMYTEEMYKKDAKLIILSVLTYAEEIPDKEKLNEVVDTLWNFERSLTNLTETNYLPNNTLIYYTRASQFDNITRNYLKNHSLDYPGNGDIWTRFITQFFTDMPDIKLDLVESDFIYCKASEFSIIAGVVRYLLESSEVDIELYAWYHAVYTMYMSEIDNVLDGVKQTVLERTRTCAGMVHNCLPLPVSYGVVEKSFLDTTRPKIDDMLSNIKQVFVERVKSCSWMDDETKSAVVEKVAAMIDVVGYPEWLFNKTALELFYIDYNDVIVENNTYLENIISIYRANTFKMLKALREKNERGWIYSPMIVNAFDLQEQNSVHILYGILALPFYHLGLEALNYGAIGTVIGHEITHGFDNKGRKYDKFGNFANWWNNKTIELFENKTQCFVDQYNSFTFPDIQLKVDGLRTLPENIADSGGIKQAFLAYKKYIDEYGAELLLPGFENYTHEQLFFIAFAQRQCSSQTIEYSKQQSMVEEHAPDSIRVMGSLQNFDEFSNAFNCPIGSKMNPKRERCEIW